MVSPARQISRRLEANSTPRQPPFLTEDVLREEILLRVASPAGLACASMACLSFYSIITDPVFLRRYRSLHPPLLLGFFDGEFRPAEAPHPSAGAGRALARAADFDFDGYVPRDGQHSWGTYDVREGRVLLKYGPWISKDGNIGFPALAVCDPLSRGYLLLPSIPRGLLDSVQIDEYNNSKAFDAIICPSKDGDEDTTFRVIAMAQNQEKLCVFIFSSGTSSWSVASSTTWEALGLAVPQSGPVLDCAQGYFSYGCFYRKVLEKNTLLQFNLSTTEFSTVQLPPNHDKLGIFIVEAGDGRPGIFSTINAQKIRYSILLNGGGQNPGDWKMVNLIPTPADYFYSIVGALGGYVFLSGQSKRNPNDAACFSVEVKGLKVKRVGRMMGFWHNIFPYFGYPPSMSPARI